LPRPDGKGSKRVADRHFGYQLPAEMACVVSPGRVAEWFKAAVLKTARARKGPRGFESHPFRQELGFSGHRRANPEPSFWPGGMRISDRLLGLRDKLRSLLDIPPLLPRLHFAGRLRPLRPSL